MWRNISKYRFVYFQEPILAKTFHRKVQSKKIFIHRENFDAIIANTEEQLAQVWYTLYTIYSYSSNKSIFKCYLDWYKYYITCTHLCVVCVDITKWFCKKIVEMVFQWIGIYCVIIWYRMLYQQIEFNSRCHTSRISNLFLIWIRNLLHHRIFFDTLFVYIVLSYRSRLIDFQ